MSKVFLLSLLFLCTVVSTRFIAGTKPTMMGAPMQKSITDQNVSKANEVMTTLNPGFQATNKKLIYFTSQVVAGINLGMVWESKKDGKPEYECVHVWQKLYSQGGGYEQTSKNTWTTNLKTACIQCHGPDNCDLSKNNLNANAGYKNAGPTKMLLGNTIV